MQIDSQLHGLTFSIDRNVVEDGPGIRTTVFLKGCPLKCVWCHSPQSQSREKQLMFIENRCIGCGECIKACPHDAQVLSRSGQHILWDECDDCGECARVCPSMALEVTGELKTVDQIIDIVQKDTAYYKNSGGGVTFSGGEPLAQSEFLFFCLEKCRKIGIHTAIDTSGFAKWSSFEKILPHTDLFLYDLKHMDNRKHKQITGVSNEPILKNLKRIDESGKSIWIRIPLIPGYNDSLENLSHIAKFVKRLSNVKKVSLLLYNSAAGAKYRFIGKHYGLEYVKENTGEEELSFLDIFSSSGLKVEIGR